MKYEEIILHPTRFISLTSLKPEEFVFLLKHLRRCATVIFATTLQWV